MGIVALMRAALGARLRAVIALPTGVIAEDAAGVALTVVASEWWLGNGMAFGREVAAYLAADGLCAWRVLLRADLSDVHDHVHQNVVHISLPCEYATRCAPSAAWPSQPENTTHAPQASS